MMNQYQKEYALAKTKVEAIEESIAEIERDYISAQNIMNSDGSIPPCIYCIDDMKVFSRANLDCSKAVIDAGLEDDLNIAKAALMKAEDALIVYGLSIAPDGLKETLANGIASNYAIRCKMIDATFRLDCSTVR